jgi:hypothetical protein
MRALWSGILLLASACGSTAPTPITLTGPVVVGPEISCQAPLMERHCGAWVSFARSAMADDTATPTAAIATWTIRNGHWDPINSHSTSVVAVVVFQLADGHVVQVPVWCSVHAPGDPACDLSDVGGPP